jgi:predicted Asp-tRNA(Asn)/Glu-tRNA(Gln) amidotransferase subunit C
MALDKEHIKIQAKQILDKFAEALAKVEKEGKQESYVDREKFERIEGDSKCKDSDFKKKILQNAPEHDDDFILVEKGSWK